MATTFSSSPSLFLTSESVTEGHPDKLCDQVSDAVLDALIGLDPMARVACETAVTTGLVVVMGEITTDAWADIPHIVRHTISSIGYTSADFGFDAETCGVMVSIKGQSPDIASGVDKGLEARIAAGEVDPFELQGAGDQGMMVGFACTETPEYMPLTISLAHKLVRRLSELRKDGTLPFVRPDGKSQVTVEYAFGQPKRVDAIVISTQHDPVIDGEDDPERVQKLLAEKLTEQVIRAVVPADLIDDQTKIYINASGRFVIGGPMGDAGVTGRKIIVDTYGGIARHGGGAFSGKDPTKVDRSAAYAARYVAKNIVAAGLADRFEIQLSYAIGVSEPVSVHVDTEGTGQIPDSQIAALVRQTFTLTPSGIIRHLNLRRPIYRKTASGGHFGRSEPAF